MTAKLYTINELSRILDLHPKTILRFIKEGRIRGNGVLVQIIGAIAGGTAIFLPGILLIYFVYPLWENLKKIKGIKASLKGIKAVAGGLISVSALILMQKSGFTWDNLIVFSLTAVMLLTKKIPAPVIVAIVITAGFLINPL